MTFIKSPTSAPKKSFFIFYPVSPIFPFFVMFCCSVRRCAVRGRQYGVYGNKHLRWLVGETRNDFLKTHELHHNSLVLIRTPIQRVPTCVTKIDRSSTQQSNNLYSAESIARPSHPARNEKTTKQKPKKLSFSP